MTVQIPQPKIIPWEIYIPPEKRLQIKSSMKKKKTGLKSNHIQDNYAEVKPL